MKYREIVFYRDGYTLTDSGYEGFLKTNLGHFIIIRDDEDMPSVFIEHFGIVHKLTEDQAENFYKLRNDPYWKQNNDYKIVRYNFDNKLSFIERFSFTISKPQDKGTVYVYECDGYYKIGYTGNAQRRKAKYITENPHEIKTVHEYEIWNAYECEQLLHEYFSGKNHRGEWFYLSRDDLQFIGYLLTDDPIFVVDDYSDYFHSRFNGEQNIIVRLQKEKEWKIELAERDKRREANISFSLI